MLPFVTTYPGENDDRAYPHYVKAYHNSADPSPLTTDNAQVFVGQPALPATFADGTSNTVMLTEHYFRRGEALFAYARYLPGTQEESGYRAPCRPSPAAGRCSAARTSVMCTR